MSVITGRDCLVSIKNIAEKCGVSIATVSKALNNHSDVSSATKKLVCDTANAMGYFPNAQAIALKTNKTFSIGVLMIDKAGSGLKHSYFSSVLDSFKVEAEKNGYDIMFINSKIGNRNMSYLEHCRYRNFDGVFVACADFCNDDIIELLKSDLPVVAVDYAGENKYSVLSDNRLGIKEIVTYVHSMGHSKIAYIYGESSQVTSNRVESFVETMESFGLEVSPDYVKKGRYHDAVSTEKIVSQMLELYEPPTCILMPDDFSALGAFRAAENAGLSIPDDISIAGYDGLYFARMTKPRFTTVIQDTQSVGKLAAELLVKVIEKKEITQDCITVKGSFISGETVKCLAKN